MVNISYFLWFPCFRTLIYLFICHPARPKSGIYLFISSKSIKFWYFIYFIGDFGSFSEDIYFISPFHAISWHLFILLVIPASFLRLFIYWLVGWWYPQLFIYLSPEAPFRKVFLILFSFISFSGTLGFRYFIYFLLAPPAGIKNIKNNYFISRPPFFVFIF